MEPDEPAEVAEPDVTLREACPMRDCESQSRDLPRGGLPGGVEFPHLATARPLRAAPSPRSVGELGTDLRENVALVCDTESVASQRLGSRLRAAFLIHAATPA